MVHVACLTGDYPNVSPAVILLDVMELRSFSLEVLTCSIRKPDEVEFRGDEELLARADTFNVLEAARSPYFC